MIHIIIAVDPSTRFLFGIIDKLKLNKVEIDVTEIHPTNESYLEAFDKLKKLEKESVILFLGHGTDEKLYGGESIGVFPRKEFIKLNEMSIFNRQYLFALSCNSAGLLRKSHKYSILNKSIGFGSLPTSNEEVLADKLLRTQGVTEATIEEFRSDIVSTISQAFCLYHMDFNKLLDYLKLIIDKKINNAILIKRDRNLADMLYKMRQEMIVF